MAYVISDALATPEIITRPGAVRHDAEGFVVAHPAFAAAAIADPILEAAAGEDIEETAPAEAQEDDVVPAQPGADLRWFAGALSLGVLVGIGLAVSLAGDSSA